MASAVSTLIKTATALCLGAALVTTATAAPKRPVKRPVATLAAKPGFSPKSGLPTKAGLPSIRDVGPAKPTVRGPSQTPPRRDKPVVTQDQYPRGSVRVPPTVRLPPPVRLPPIVRVPTPPPDRPPVRVPDDGTPLVVVRPPVIVTLPPIRPPVVPPRTAPPRQPPLTFIPLSPPGRPGARPPDTSPPGTPPPPAATPPAQSPPPAAVVLDTFVPDEVLIALPLTTPETLEADVALAFNLTILERSTMSLLDQRLVRLRIPDRRAVAAVVAALQGDARVPAAQPNYIYRYQQNAPVQPAALSTQSGAQYTLSRINLDAQRGTRGRGLTIAVIDSGVERAHPDFANQRIDELDALDSVPLVTGAKSSNLDPHGTGVAGVIAGRGLVQGIAPDVRLLSVRAFGNAQNRGSAFAITSAIVKGLNWSVENGARVVNMSFTGARDPVMERTIAALSSRRVIAVAAAGNGGAAAAPAYPAAYPGVIAVTATDASDRLYDKANRGAYVAVAAPGVDVLVPAGRAEHDLASGTSFAAPHVAGLVALMLDVNPDLSPEHIRQVLLSAVDDLGQPGRDDHFGAGRINADKAIAAAIAFRPALAGAP